MTVGELKARLNKYDDNLSVCRLNNCDFPVEITEIKIHEGNYLECCYDYVKVTKNESVVLLR